MSGEKETRALTKNEKRQLRAQALADLQRRSRELEAQLVHRLHAADVEIERAGTPRMMASAVILSLTALGGREIVSPVAIRDGLSPETIEAIRRDLARSWQITTAQRPSLAREKETET